MAAIISELKASQNMVPDFITVGAAQKYYPQDLPTVLEEGTEFFVGGLSGSTTEDEVTQYFTQFGQVTSLSIVKGSTRSKNSAGFGFIRILLNIESCDFLQKRHTINNCQLDLQLAVDREAAKQKEYEEQTRKLFVGGLPRNLPDSSLKEYFQQFGEVQKAYVVKDFRTG